MKKRYNNYILGFAVLALLAACGEDKPAEAHEEHEHSENRVGLTQEQAKTVEIAVGKLEMKTLSGTIRVNGVLDVPPQNLVSISAPYGGTVKNTEMLQGMRVRKGQVVAMIQNPEFISFQQD